MAVKAGPPPAKRRACERRQADEMPAVTSRFDGDEQPAHIRLSDDDKMRALRDTDELRAAVGQAIAAADAAELQKANGKAKGKGKGNGDAGGDAGGWYMAPGGQPQWRPHGVTGVQVRDARGRKRGGWYNRYQLLAESVLSQNDKQATRMALHFYGGDGDF